MSLIKFTWGRGWFAAILAAVLAVFMVQPSWAEYPEKTITILVPYSAGSGNDTFARLIAAGLQEKWGQPVVVVNKPGAGGMLAATEVAHSAPDGYTLLTGSSSLSSGMAMRKDPPIDLTKDLTAVAQYCHSSGALVINPSLPVTSVKDFIEYSQTHPLNFGSSGTGSIIHLTSELFKQITGLKATHIPYGGGAPATKALIGGEVQFNLIDYGATKAAVLSGQVKLLAMAGSERNPGQPDVPTIKELGYDYEFLLNYGLFAPSATPAAVLATLNAAVNEIVATQKFKDYAEGSRDGTVVTDDGPGVYQKLVESEVKQYNKVVDDTGIPRL